MEVIVPTTMTILTAVILAALRWLWSSARKMVDDFKAEIIIIREADKKDIMDAFATLKVDHEALRVELKTDQARLDLARQDQAIAISRLEGAAEERRVMAQVASTAATAAATATAMAMAAAAVTRGIEESKSDQP